MDFVRAQLLSPCFLTAKLFTEVHAIALNIARIFSA